MTGQNRQANQARKSAKPRQTKEKFQPEREEKAKPIIAKTHNQKLFLQAATTQTLIVAKGSAGVGKTYLAACIAANKLLKGEINKIVLVRPYVQMGRSSGFWPGSIEDRLEPYFAPILSVLRERLGESNFNCLYGKSILIQPMEAVRGMDFKDTLLIGDEQQNTTREEMRCLVTRLSEGSQFILVGDDKQADIRPKDSGLLYLVDLIQRHSIKSASVIEFNSFDIVRSGIVAQFVRIFDEEGALR